MRRTAILPAVVIAAVAVALAACGPDDPAADVAGSAATAPVPAVRAADERGGTVLRGRLNDGVTFPMFTRSHVTGAEANPLFRRLNAATEAPDWNFSTYLVDRRGRVAARFDASVPPDDPRVTAAVAALPGEPADTRARVTPGRDRGRGGHHVSCGFPPMRGPPCPVSSPG